MTCYRIITMLPLEVPLYAYYYTSIYPDNRYLCSIALI